MVPNKDLSSVHSLSDESCKKNVSPVKLERSLYVHINFCKNILSEKWENWATNLSFLCILRKTNRSNSIRLLYKLISLQFKLKHYDFQITLTMPWITTTTVYRLRQWWWWCCCFQRFNSMPLRHIISINSSSYWTAYTTYTNYCSTASKRTNIF